LISRNRHTIAGDARSYRHRLSRVRGRLEEVVSLCLSWKAQNGNAELIDAAKDAAS
jgi:hypothetical protein